MRVDEVSSKALGLLCTLRMGTSGRWSAWQHALRAGERQDLLGKAEYCRSAWREPPPS
jgi:hypothetical protein